MKKYKVTLTTEERQQLHTWISAGKASAKKLAHARILLKADQADGGPAWIDGAPIQGAAPVPPGARVHIGQTTLRFDAVQPAAAAPAPPPAPGSRKPSKGLIAAYVVMGLIAKWLLGSVFANHGAQAGVIVLAAVVPAPLLVALVLLIDRYEPEPRRVLAITYLYGATAAVFDVGHGKW